MITNEGKNTVDVEIFSRKKNQTFMLIKGRFCKLKINLCTYTVNKAKNNQIKIENF